MNTVYRNIEVLSVHWFSVPTGTLGIVKGKDTITEEIKIYLGQGTGVREDRDIEQIIDWGAKVTESTLKNLLKK